MAQTVETKKKAGETQGVSVRGEKPSNQAAAVWCSRLQTVVNALVVLFAATLCLPITVNWAILAAGLVGWVLVLALRMASGQQVYRKPPLFYPLWIMAGAATIAGIANGGGVHDAYKSFMTLRPLIVYFWAFDAFARNERLQPLCLSAALSLSAVAGFCGTVEQIANFHPFGFRYLQGTGFLGGPMAFAGQMQLFSIISMALIFTDGYKKLLGKLSSLPWFSIVAAGNILGVIFASERNAWLGFFVGALLVTILVSWRTAAKVGAAGAVLAAVGWNCIPVFKTRLLPLLDPMHDVSARARLVVWEKAWQLSCTHPIFGVGPLNFPHIVIPEALVPGQPQYLAHAHNNYLHILATMGAVGLCAYTWLLFASLKLAWNQFHNSARAGLQHALGLGLLGSLVALAVAGMFEYNFGTGQVRLAEWFFLAFLIPPAAKTLQNLHR